MSPEMPHTEAPENGIPDTENWWLPILLALLITLAALAFIAWHLRPGEEGILSYDGREEPAAATAPTGPTGSEAEDGVTPDGSPPPPPSPEREAPPPD